MFGKMGVNTRVFGSRMKDMVKECFIIPKGIDL